MPEVAEALNIELVSLEEIFERSDVVSCHTPLLDSTREMLQRGHFLWMKRGATFINTARGGVVDEEAICAVFAERPDLGGAAHGGRTAPIPGGQTAHV